MKKLGIIIDSFSGREKEEIEKEGFYFIPQQVIINGESKAANEGIKQEDMAKLLETNPVIQTSQPSIGEIDEVFEKASKENDHVIFLTIQKDISSTYSTAQAAAANFDNITVISSTLVGYMFFMIGKWAKKAYAEGKSIDYIKEMIFKYDESSLNFVLPFSIKRLIQSGRVTGAKKFILRLGSLIPGLILTNNGFKSMGMPKRTFKGLIKSAMKKIALKVENQIEKWQLEIHYSGEKDILKISKEQAKEIGFNNPLISLISPVVSAHTGSGVGILLYKKEVE